MKRCKRFLKENLILAIGICLPLIVAIVFATITILPKAFTGHSKFDLLYMTMAYPHDGVSAEVINGQLKISITPEVRNGTLPMPRLFRFNAKSLSSTEISIELPTRSHILVIKKKEILEIPEIKNLKLDPNSISPDGYKVEFSTPDYGIASSFLVSSSYKRSLIMGKNGETIEIIEETNNTYGDKSIKFLGWIIAE